MSDFKVQFVSGVIPSATATVDVNSPAFAAVADFDKSFMIPSTNMNGAGVGNTTGSVIGTLANKLGLAKLIDIDTVRFDDLDTANARDDLCGAQLVEYIGPTGGPNEVIVRAVQDFTGTALTFDGPAIAGIVTLAKVVPFIFIGSNLNSNATQSHTAHAEVVFDGVNNVVRMTKGEAVATLSVRVYVVEFVGSNWSVQKVTHAFAVSDTNEDDVISAVTLANSWVYSTYKGANGTNAQNLWYVWLFNTTTLRHRVKVRVNGQTTKSYVISNPQMTVAVYGADPDGVSDLVAGGSVPETRNITITAIPDLSAALVSCHMGSDAAVTNGGMVTMVDLNSTTNVRVRRSENSGDTEYKIQVVDLSQAIGLSVDSIDTITDGVNFVITGRFGTVTAVTLGGVSQTAVGATGTTITRTGVLGTLKYGVGYNLVVTAGGVDTTPGITINPPGTKRYVDLSTLTGSGTRLTATPDIAAGDQVEWTNVIGGVLDDVVVFDDGSFSAAPGVTAFDFRVNDGTGWGTVATQTITPAAADSQNLIRRMATDLTRLIAFNLTNIEHDS